MFNSILFIVSSIILIIVFLLLKKSDNKLNITKWIFISLILLFCFNSLLAYILSYIKIPVTLLTVSLIYILTSLLICFFFLKKEIQKYYFSKKNLIHLLILLVIVVIISFIRFGLPFSITYQTIDPAVHFQSSYSFYKESILLNFAQDKTAFNFVTWRFASYTNLGLIFKLFSPFVDENNFYNIYILYDILTLLMTAILFYYLINNENNKIIRLVGTILFLLGYPLNNLLIGFFYVGHASCIIITTMIIIREFKVDNIPFFILFLLNIGLTFTYYLYIPFVFLAEFIYFIKTKNMIKKYFFIFGIPIILGFIYFIIPTFNNTNMDLINQSQLDGYFYNDVLGNSLLFLPIISYYFFRKFKERELNFELIMVIGLLTFMVVLNICMLLHLIMPYYVSKYYYILWIICFAILFTTYDEYYEQEKFIFKNYAIFMVFTIILSITNIENKIINLNSSEWNKTTPSMLFNVYSYNMNLIKKPLVVFTSNEIVDVKRIANEIDNDFITNAEAERILWLINFWQINKVNCPVNQTYECVKNLYNVDINAYLYYNNYSYTNKKYIIFTRNIFLTELYIDPNILKLIDNIKNNNIITIE